MDTIAFELLAIFIFMFITEAVLIMIDKDICHLRNALDEIKHILRRKDDK